MLPKWTSLLLYAIALVFVIVAVVVFHEYTTPSFGTSQKSIDTGWSSVVGTTTTPLDTLPNAIDIQGNDTLTLTRTLDKDVLSNDTLAFFTAFNLVDVSIDGKDVYQLRPPAESPSKTPGKTWNFIDISTATEGQTLSIVLTDIYHNGSVNIPVFFSGSDDSVALSFIRQQMIGFIISILIFLASVVTLIYWVIQHKKEALTESATRLALFAFPLAIWSIIETQLPVVFFGMPLLFNQIAFMALMVLSFAIFQFYFSFYGLKNSKIAIIISVLYIIDFVISLSMQFLGIADFMETSNITVVITLVAGVYIGIVTLQTFLSRAKRSTEVRRIMWIHLGTLFVVFLFSLADGYRSYFTYNIDSAVYTRIGLLIYIIVMAILVMDSSVKLLQEGRHAHAIKLEAETDALTKLKNRSAYDNAIKDVPAGEYANYGIVMCDLNNLKMFNDLYGHNMGDTYIKTCANLLHDTFQNYGTMYRVGGDEFVGIMRKLDVSVADQLREQLHERTEAESNKEEMISKGLHMAIAVGYAPYDATKDKSLADTRERADELMYEVKSHMEHRGNTLKKDAEKPAEKAEGVVSYSDLLATLQKKLNDIRDGKNPKETKDLSGFSAEYRPIMELVNGIVAAIAEKDEFQLLKLELLVKASHIGLWDMMVVRGDPVNPLNKFVWSDEFRKMLGYQDEQDFPNVTASWSDKLHPDDKQRTLDAFQAHLVDRTGQTPYDIEYRLLHKNGQYIYFRAYGETLRDEEGYPLRVVGALDDITQEKKAEFEKETGALRLKLLQKSLNIALWDLDVDPHDPVNGDNHFYWSPEFRALLGFTDEQDFPNVLGSWSNRLHPEDQERVLAAFAAHMMDYSGKTPYHVEYRLKRKTGEYVWYRADGETLRTDEGVPLHAIGSLSEMNPSPS